MAGESADGIKAADAPQVAGNNKPNGQGAQAKEVDREQDVPDVGPVGFCLGILVVALVMAVVHQSNIVKGGNLSEFYASLFEEHVVLPPFAHESVCTIQFCQGWGTNGLYNQIAQLVKHRSDAELQVVPEEYPAAPINQLAANMVGSVQILIMASLFFNDKLLPEGMRENKMAAIFGVFLGANMLSSALTKTNAFEIYVGRKLIFSALEGGRTPNAEDLIRAFASVGVTLSL